MSLNLGHSSKNTYRDRAPGILALPGAFAPGRKLPDVIRQVVYNECGDHRVMYRWHKNTDTINQKSTKVVEREIRRYGLFVVDTRNLPSVVST